VIISLILKDCEWHYYNFLELNQVIKCEEAEEKGMCKNCQWAFSCHPMQEIKNGIFQKYCTLDFRKKYMPNLKIGDLC